MLERMKMAGLAGLAALAAVGAAAQEGDPDPAEGQALFAAYCAQCHGADATGNGPMAEIIAVPTPDLTQLSARNGGEFPYEAVARQIDGRNRVLAHGGDMPVFGPFLSSDVHAVFRLPSGQPMMTGMPVAELIVWLESVQAE